MIYTGPLVFLNYIPTFFLLVSVVGLLLLTVVEGIRVAKKKKMHKQTWWIFLGLSLLYAMIFGGGVIFLLGFRVF